MFHAIFPSFIAVMFAVQDLAVGSYTTSQRVVFAGVVVASLLASVAFAKSEK